VLAKVKIEGWARQKAPPAVKTLYWASRRHYNHLRQLRGLVRPVCNFLRDQVTLRRAEEEIKKRLDGREESFLDLVRQQIYAHPTSPYLNLLKHAGCDFSDLRAYVKRRGLEETLQRLASEGVYLTSEEFKGKKEVVRGTESFRISPADFDTAGSHAGYRIQSSGTRNAPVSSYISFDSLALRSYAACVFFSAHDFFSYCHAVYDGILPASGGVNNLLIYSRIGVGVDRWFARIIPDYVHKQSHFLQTWLIVALGKSVGSGFPRPEFIDIREVHRIVEWIVQQNRGGRVCCVTATASNAIRIARVACEMGVSLSGNKFICVGEPFTEGKREIIERAGAKGTTRYAYGGGTNIGFGCANPAYTDEVHVNQHMFALISHSRRPYDNGPGLRPLLCTTLYPYAPRMLLNVENGDYVTFDKRNCGCGLDKVGLTLHVHRIRSFEKFASEGANYTYTDLFDLLEKTFPTEFGGGPGDYQLVEEEDENGQTRLSLVVDPAVGDINEQRLLSRLRDALGELAWHSRFWQDAGTFRIKRAIPHTSARGKLLPLHIAH
jgi:hypothetical protein